MWQALYINPKSILCLVSHVVRGSDPRASHDLPTTNGIVIRLILSETSIAEKTPVSAFDKHIGSFQAQPLPRNAD